MSLNEKDMEWHLIIVCNMEMINIIFIRMESL